MKCPKCGRVWAENVAFCPVDDAALLPGEGEATTGQPDQVRPSAAAPPPAAFTDETTAVNGESIDSAPPRRVEPIAADDPEQTWVSPKTTYVSEPERTARHRLNVPIGAPPAVAHSAPPRHPSAANSNPWKVAFLAMIGVLAIGGILFWLLRSNPNIQNGNVAPLTPDPNSSPVLTSSPPSGGDEIGAPTVASPPPFGGTEPSPSVTPTPLASPTVSPELPTPAPTPATSPSPSPRPTNQPPNPEPDDTPPPPRPASSPRPTPMPRSSPL